jgi:hypothetical protein|tara:strand:- start:331 stop:654 length:324 start_codon:yes stop_codon:yes gene_type:complete
MARKTNSPLNTDVEIFEENVAGIPVAFQDIITLADLQAKPNGRIAFKNIDVPLAEGIRLKASIWINKSALSPEDFQVALENKKRKDALKGATLNAESRNNKTVYTFS